MFTRCVLSPSSAACSGPCGQGPTREHWALGSYLGARLLLCAGFCPCASVSPTRESSRCVQGFGPELHGHVGTPRTAGGAAGPVQPEPLGTTGARRGVWECGMARARPLPGCDVSALVFENRHHACGACRARGCGVHAPALHRSQTRAGLRP